MKSQHGFTLIEVLIALVIVAVALAALSQTMGQYVFQQSGLQQRIVATWVAQNRLIELQQALETSGQGGEKKQTVKFMGADWQTELLLENTLIPTIQKATLQVTLQTAPGQVEKNPSAALVSVVGK